MLKLNDMLKLKAYLVFISMVAVHAVCHYWQIDIKKD